MSEELGISWAEAGAVVLTTTVMYLLVVTCIRVVGQRRLAGMSVVDLGCVMAIGAVLGRTALPLRPTLLAGVVAMLTLFGAQAALSRLRRSRRVDRIVDRAPVLLMSGGERLEESLRANQVTEADLRQRLRLAGIRHLDEVRYVVLERNGTMSVIRQGEPLDPWLLADVPGAGRLGRTPTRPDTPAPAEHDIQAPPA